MTQHQKAHSFFRAAAEWLRCRDLMLHGGLSDYDRVMAQVGELDWRMEMKMILRGKA